MKTIIKYAWTWWIGSMPALVGITFMDWRWWVFTIVTIILVEASFRAREKENN